MNGKSSSHQSSGNNLCVNHCGFFGSPATMNLCSKCFKDSLLPRLQTSDFCLNPADDPPKLRSSGFSDDENQETLFGVPPTSSPTRCERCKKKIALNGFECRCGGTFCTRHRHREEHDCPFDVKAVGRETIAKENPSMKADKLEKI